MRKILLIGVIAACVSVTATLTHAVDIGFVDDYPVVQNNLMYEKMLVISSYDISQNDKPTGLSQSCENCHTQSGITDKLSSVAPGNGIMHTRYVSFHPDRKGFQRKC